jgi:hypothetical protein
MSFDISDDGGRSPNANPVFEHEAQARLEQRRAEAEIEFHRAYERRIDSGDITGDITEEVSQWHITQLIIDYASSRFFAFAKEALEAYVDTSTARKLIEMSLFTVVDSAFLTKHRAALRADRTEPRRRFHEQARFMITHSPEWLEMQEALVERAKRELEAIAFLRQCEQAAIDAMPGRGLPKADVAETTSQAQTEIRRRRGRPSKNPNLHPEVEVYLDGVSEFAKSAQSPHGGLRREITIADFCIVSGFKDDTIFGAWRRGDTARFANPHARKFEATLKLSLIEFLNRLNQASQ